MKDETKNLLYVPPPQPPADFDKRLREITGVCPTGEPGFRFVWGCDRMKWYGGREDQAYIDPNGKYVGLPYFVAEGWTPETVYDREEWERSRYGMLTDDMNWGPCAQAQPNYCFAPEHMFTGYGLHRVWDATVDVLGPFPEKGVWDLVAFCHKPAPDFNPLSWDEMLNLAREWKHNRERPNAVPRMIDDYMRFNDRVKAMRQKAFDERMGEHAEFLAEELARQDTNRVNSFDIEGATPSVVAKRQIEPGMTETKAGLIVPSSALNH